MRNAAFNTNHAASKIAIVVIFSSPRESETLESYDKISCGASDFDAATHHPCLAVARLNALHCTIQPDMSWNPIGFVPGLVDQKIAHVKLGKMRGH